MKTGIFRLKTGAPLSLEFHRSAGVSVSESVHDLSLRPEIWHVKQIKEFVTRLGFLSSKESSGDKAKEFLSINEVRTYRALLDVTDRKVCYYPLIVKHSILPLGSASEL